MGVFALIIGIRRSKPSRRFVGFLDGFDTELRQLIGLGR